MIQTLIKKSQQTGVPLYLETETEDNVKLYERFGFKLVKQILLDKIDLPMWEMLREP